MITLRGRQALRDRHPDADGAAGSGGLKAARTKGFAASVAGAAVAVVASSASDGSSSRGGRRSRRHCSPRRPGRGLAALGAEGRQGFRGSNSACAPQTGQATVRGLARVMPMPLARPPLTGCTARVRSRRCPRTGGGAGRRPGEVNRIHSRYLFALISGIAPVAWSSRTWTIWKVLPPSGCWNRCRSAPDSAERCALSRSSHSTMVRLSYSGWNGAAQAGDVVPARLGRPVLPGVVRRQVELAGAARR